MSIEVRVRNTTTATTLAARTIPDTALSELNAVFPGTPAEAADAALRVMLQALHDYVMDVRVAGARNTAMADVAPAETAQRDATEIAFPRPV